MVLFPSSIARYHNIVPLSREELLNKAWSKNYVRPLRCRFYIKDRTEDTTFYTWDGFAEDNSLAVESVALNLAEGGNGSAIIKIWHDSDNPEIFQRANGMLRGSVILQIGKTQSELTNALYCVNPVLGTERPDTNQMYYQLECKGKVVMLDERLVTFVRHAAYATINESVKFNRTDKMQAYKLVNDLFTKEKIMPLGSYQNSIQEHGNYLLTGISSKVNDFIAALDLELASARQVLDTISGLSGAIWKLNNDNNVIFEYPHEQHTGILISGDGCNPKNLGWASFPIGRWGFKDHAESPDFATSIIGKSDNPINTADSASVASNANEKMHEQDHAQQFTITTQDFSELVLLIEKRGDPESDLHFHIVEDNANAPTGKKIAEGTIDIDTLEEEPTPHFLTKLRFQKKPKIGTLAWIILYRVEGEDDDETVAWYHDDGTTGTSAMRDVEAEEGEDEITLKKPNHNSNSGWVTSVGTGKKFVYSIYDIANFLTIAYDPRAISKFGWVDKFVDLSFTSHTNTAMMIMFAYLAESSKAKRIWDFPMVTIPDLPYIYWPEQWVTIHDNLANLTNAMNHMFKVNSVGYLFSAVGDGIGGSPYGCRTCRVTGTSFVDYLFDDPEDQNW